MNEDLKRPGPWWAFERGAQRSGSYVQAIRLIFKELVGFGSREATPQARSDAEMRHGLARILRPRRRSPLSAACERTQAWRVTALKSCAGNWSLPAKTEATQECWLRGCCSTTSSRWSSSRLLNTSDADMGGTGDCGMEKTLLRARALLGEC